MSEGMQITIPDFEEDDYHSTPIFGRPQGGGLWGTPSSGQDSPTILTPLALPERADKSYFHARGDSNTSEDSTNSLQHGTRKIKSPFVHSAQSSLATSATGGSSFSKKTSFASLRNAFKKSTEPAPPLPVLDHQAYPVLKNPFSRSTSSLAQLPPMSHKQQPSTHASPPHFRPPTPASADSRFRSAPPRAREHAYAPSQHSHSGSIFHNSDAGSDHGHYFPMSSSPPPVPPVPYAFAHDEGRSSFDLEEKINMDPRTPSDYALHAIFIRFAAAAEAHINEFLRQSLESDPRLNEYMGPNVDPKFDGLLLSLGKIAQKHAKPVVDSVMRWRKSQNEAVDGDVLRYHSELPSTSTRSMRPQDVYTVLHERKSLASIYIMCRALIAVTHSMSKDGLGDAVGHSLEELTFEQFRRPDLKMLSMSPNHRINADLYATLLGQIANIRFESVTDRFLVELGPVAAGQVPKDSDFKYENLVKGLRHVQIKVWPPESFEEGAEFLASLSKSFENAHGNRLKTTFAETLIHMLHPIAKTAQAEVNHPEWAKAIEVIYPRVKDMMNKPRYWHVAYPLAVTTLCVAPQDFFLRNWNICFEAGLGKLKEKIHRIQVMNGILRLMWTYLYRCHESPSTATGKIETILKHFFPANRLVVNPPEEHIEPFIYIIHFILSRHFDFGSEFCLELLQEQSISANNGNFLAPERVAIATHAILRSLHGLEAEEHVPSWPSSSDYTQYPSQDDYPTSSDPLPSSLILKLGWKDLMERSSTCLTILAKSCYNVVGKWSVLDDQWTASRLNPAYEETHNFIIRRHPEGTVAFPSQYSAHISILQTAYQAWPRCLHSSLAYEDVFDMLIRGVVHVEPGVGEAATLALQRFMTEGTHISSMLSRFYVFLFDRMVSDGGGLRLNVESPRLLTLWLSFIGHWIHNVSQQPLDSLTAEDVKEVMARVHEIETGSLFLLAHNKRPVHTSGVKAMRLLASLQSHIRASQVFLGLEGAFHIVSAFHGSLERAVYLEGYEDFLEPEEAIRLDMWKRECHDDVALRIVDSDTHVDHLLWVHVCPPLLRACMEISSSTISSFREHIVAVATRYHPFMVQLSGVQNKLAPNLPQRAGSFGEKDASKLVNEHKQTISQWHFWTKTLCATAQVSDVRLTAIRDHSRARSEANLERDQMMTTRDLFKYLSQFLDSDHSLFRDVAVFSISSFPAHGYSQLLEDLNILASRQFYDDARPKASTMPVIGRARRQERFHTAVARIYFMTARLLQDQRSSGKQTALTHVLKYIRNMQSFLTASEHRNEYSLQRLRRYFCGTVERLFDGLATLKDSDRFIPHNTHLALYRLCEEWCQLGKQSQDATRRLVLMQTAAGKSLSEPAHQAENIQRFQTETKALSNAAVGAMASLCHKAFYPPDQSSISPTEKLSTSESNHRPLDVSSMLDRLTAVLASFHEPVQLAGKKALRSLLVHSPSDPAILDEVLRRAFVTTRDLETSNARLFQVVADVICTASGLHGFSFSQVACLGLSNLCHTRSEIRRQAFNMLEVIHEQSSGLISLSQYEAAACSSAPTAYLNAHRLVSSVLAGEHPSQALQILSRFTGWIPKVYDGQSDRGLILLLQSLEFWMPNIDLLDSKGSGISRDGCSAIYYLLALTLRYMEGYSEQIFVLWSRLVDPPHNANGFATIRFLLDLTARVGSTTFVTCVAKVVVCLTQSAIGAQVFADTVGLVDPSRVLPDSDHRSSVQGPEGIEGWPELSSLLSEKPKLILGYSQFALLFLSDVTMEETWPLTDQLPALLHSVLMHLSHKEDFVKKRSLHMLLQMLRVCVSGYEDIGDRFSSLPRSELKLVLEELETEAQSHLWSDDESGITAEPKLRWFISRIVKLSEASYPDLRTRWGWSALCWGTSCPKRELAYRSLQVYRALAPPVGRPDLDVLLGRLAATIAGEDLGMQNFNVEIILTINAMSSAKDLDIAFLPKLFWVAVACLSTTVENEFLHALQLIDTLLSRLDLDDPAIVELLLERRPPMWTGSSSIQACMLTGLRSSSTSGTTLKLLQRLTKISDPRLIDASDGRVRDLYTLSLPWCLHDMANGSQSEALQEFALNIGRLAEEEERPSIDRIMTSFAKSRFRTKEDFLREAVASLREHYGSEHWAEVITLLMGLVLNRESWLRIHTMQILKVLFQQRETRSPVDLLGSELLMPLLRLLETDLASQALEVLDEPLQISGGPAAKHVLRMSLYHHLRADAKEVESVAEIFGIAQESGWCVPRTGSLREMCRSNISAIYGSSQSSARPSRIDFQSDEVLPLADDLYEDDLGDMVQNLHELSSFFQEEHSLAPMPNRQLEARVAAILAKSTDLASDIPQTPFADVFHIGNLDSYDDDSDDSDYDNSSDLFEFDSPSISRLTSKTAHY
ncbi:uncharacterized protein FIBRA_06922 [Fibroporia radiculosa]|uniref:Cell morphogenesis protein N-terminal domain-containing protein n=1 Tax=Fibroporia radiculosa TaxID=599839 RepID=J4H4C1_9APHY|nr:uncharacterized protein FIBRA_06922 [Fibroporia radiculosa]CCM04734.1 predicted protein [Fibroporia radiculosa]